MRIIDQFIVVSNSTKNELKYKLNFNNVTVIENGIDKHKFKNLNSSLKLKLNFDTQTKNKFIFTVGHFELRKII